MKYKKEKFLVYGLKKSGVAAANFLLSVGAEVGLYDDDDNVKEEKDVLLLVEKGAKILDVIDENEEDYEERKKNLLTFSTVIVSPGVKIDSPLIVYLKRSGKRVIGELELGYLNVRAPLVAVSGTNGKTTVCNIISDALNAAGEKSYLVGNVGSPLIDAAFFAGFSDVCVTEVSSFQLETIEKFSAPISVLLNVTEDHLDRHYTMENYVYLKKRLFKNSTRFDTAVLNYDDEIVRKIGSALDCKKVWFSLREKVDGAYFDDGKIYYRGEEILNTDDLIVKGEHNVLNALAAVCALKVYGVESKDIEKSLCSFGGVDFRLQDKGEYGGVKYINDSKSTNVDSGIKAVDYMTQDTIMILGGKDKNQDYSPLFKAIKNREDVIKHVVIIGECRYKMLKKAISCDYLQVSVANDLETAVKIAKTIAKSGDCILFSPSASSFDAYENYIERGKRFNELIADEN